MLLQESWAYWVYFIPENTSATMCVIHNHYHNNIKESTHVFNVYFTSITFDSKLTILLCNFTAHLVSVNLPFIATKPLNFSITLLPFIACCYSAWLSHLNSNLDLLALAAICNHTFDSPGLLFRGLLSLHCIFTCHSHSVQRLHLHMSYNFNSLARPRCFVCIFAFLLLKHRYHVTVQQDGDQLHHQRATCLAINQDDNRCHP